MLEHHSLLEKFKKSLQASAPVIEGTVRAHQKGFGFLETDQGDSYFIPPPYMKKIMHGDKVAGQLRSEHGRNLFEPQQLLIPALTRFVGRLSGSTGKWLVTPDQILLKTPLPCGIDVKLHTEHLKSGDWVVAQLKGHALEGRSGFYAEITEFIAAHTDHFARWWVALSRYEIDRKAPDVCVETEPDETITREDLTDQFFFTIDGFETKDMDDAIYIEKDSETGQFSLWVAIADPTSYIPIGSELDKIASMRAFTSYLPSFNIPMLPRKLAEDLCALKPNERRSALVCRVTVAADGTLQDDAHFSLAWIRSKARLTYEQVSDWIEGTGKWRPDHPRLEVSLRHLKEFAVVRIAWRELNALMFKDRPEYRFLLDEKGKVRDIRIETRRIANRMVEEAMIAVNICAAEALSEGLGYGVFNIHSGFDSKHIAQVEAILQEQGGIFESNLLLTRSGFCSLRRYIEQQPTSYLESRLRRYQSFVEISDIPGEHFGMGLEAYATWTSPIRKYGDLLNHRLLKALIAGEQPEQLVDKKLLGKLAERRRLNRLAEREVSDWLYASFLENSISERKLFHAEIMEVNRGGIRVQLVENGAYVFIPVSRIHSTRDGLQCIPEKGCILLEGIPLYRVGDTLDVIIEASSPQDRNIIAAPAA